MAKKRNNNLVVLNYKDGEKKYYTSKNKAGLAVGIASPSVAWAIAHNNVLTDNQNREFTIGVIDGSEIKYKYINNN